MIYHLSPGFQTSGVVMNHIQKKKCRMSSVISVFLLLSIYSANGQEMSLEGTDMSLEDLVNIKINKGRFKK